MWKENIYSPAAIARAKKQAKKRLLRQIAKDAMKACSKPDMKIEIERMARAIALKQATKPQAVKFKPIPAYTNGMGKEFYRTQEWRRLRYKALQQHGARCQCCGQTEGYIHVDHIRPRSKHPSMELVLSNLQILCESCNMGKSNLDDTDWRKVPGVALAPSKA